MTNSHIPIGPLPNPKDYAVGVRLTLEHLGFKATFERVEAGWATTKCLPHECIPFGGECGNCGWVNNSRLSAMGILAMCGPAPGTIVHIHPEEHRRYFRGGPFMFSVVADPSVPRGTIVAKPEAK